jgi:putative transposase
LCRVLGQHRSTQRSLPAGRDGSAIELDRRHRRSVRPVHSTWRSRARAFRQRFGVHRQGVSGLDHRGRGEDSLHRAGQPWENGFTESFNARLRDELLDGEIFYSLAEAKIVIESCRHPYNTVRPPGSLGYEPPASEMFIPAMGARAAAQLKRMRMHIAARPAAPPALAQKSTLN